MHSIKLEIAAPTFAFPIPKPCWFGPFGATYFNWFRFTVYRSVVLAGRNDGHFNRLIG